MQPAPVGGGVQLADALLGDSEEELWILHAVWFESCPWGRVKRLLGP
jgi:hypothetical protein